MNTLLLQPNDVLFFKDGRPMAGGLAGHGAAWPLPTVTSAALHAALWRAGLADASHLHRPGRNGKPVADTPSRRFGSLVTAGPFPVKAAGNAADEWFFPRPADAQAPGSAEVTLQPVLVDRSAGEWSTSLPSVLTHAVASSRPPEKQKPAPWWSHRAYQHYLHGTANPAPADGDFNPDDAIFLAEATVGISMDAATGTADAENGKIYSAHYLRLRDTPESWRLGLLAACEDPQGGDLLARLFADERRILVGGQQRACTVEGPHHTPSLPLPAGRTAFTPDADGKCRVKWVLLSPAVWPEIPPKTKTGADQNPHSGGWLPNWVAERECLVGGETFDPGAVFLQHDLKRTARSRVKTPGTRIHARLAAAVVPKAIPVTGYTLPHEAVDEERRQGGPKPTHLAVPAGAVYYFTAESPEDAARLAAVLNWHGQPDRSRIKNRRSTLFGEKGFGLGVCGTWTPLNA